MPYTRDSEDDLVYNREVGNYSPTFLYGYTNSNISSDQLYGWTITSAYASCPTVIYTKTANPTTSTPIYDINGNEIDMSSRTGLYTHLSSASDSSLEFTYSNVH